MCTKVDRSTDYVMCMHAGYVLTVKILGNIILANLCRCNIHFEGGGQKLPIVGAINIYIYIATTETIINNGYDR